MEWVRRALLMTDVERSTLLWQEAPAAMATAIARHDEIADTVIAEHNGRLIKARGEGDSTFSVFESTAEAAKAALAMQEAVRSESWHGLSRPVAVRAAINYGEIEDRSGDCYGPEVNLCARLRAAAHPRQILASGSAYRHIRELGAESNLALAALGLHRLKDLAEPVEVYQVDEPGSVEDFGPIGSLNATAGFLPQFGTQFLCRAAELKEFGQLLRRQNLVTISGPGGVGKSRFAVEAARLYTAWTPDGAWYVDLSGVRPETIAGVIASVLKLRPEASVDAESLANELATKDVLIVLDGCELVLHDLVPLVKKILQCSNRIRIAVASRGPLKLSGEQVFRLLPLQVSSGAAEFEDIESCDAVKFFVSRAVLARHDFALTPRNARAVASICGQLDGIPAALEMAAIRMRSLTPEQIATRLGGRRSLDGAGSLQALFDWSWESLSATEQRFAWLMTAFEGSFSLEAAESLCEKFEGSAESGGTSDFIGARVDPFTVIDAIDSLVEKSLLIADQADASMRYRLSSTFREYVLGKWTDAPQDLLERVHAEYFLDLSAEADKTSVELDARNFGRAIDYFGRVGSAEHAAQLALFMTEHWQSAGQYAEGCQTMRDCLAQCTREWNPGSYSRLLNAIGLFEYYLGQFAQAREHLADADETARELDDPTLRSKALNNMALTYMAQGETDNAIEKLEEALPFDRVQKDESQLAISLSNLGYLFILKGDLDRAKEHLSEALQVTGRIDDRRSAIACLVNLSDLALEGGDLVLASEYARRGMAYAEEFNHAVGIACALTNLGEVALREEKLEEAEGLLRRALARCIDMSASWLIGSILDLLAIVYWRRSRLEPATLALVHRQAASSVPSPPRYSEEVDAIYSQVATQAGEESLARLRHRAEKGGVAALLDELPRG